MTRADMDAVRDEFVAATRARRRGRLRPARAPHGARLPAELVPVAADQRARRRVRARSGEVPARGLRGVPRGVAGARSRCRCGSAPPTGSRAASTATTRSRSRGGSSRSGCDIVDVSTGQVSPDQKPAYGRSFQTPYADRIRHEAGIPVIAVGAISTYDDVNTIILAGRADLCALARPHLWDPHWTLHAAADQGVPMEWIAAVPVGLAGAQHRQGRAARCRCGASTRGPGMSDGRRHGRQARHRRGDLRAVRGRERGGAVERRPRRHRRGRGRARVRRARRSTCWSTTPACRQRAGQRTTLEEWERQLRGQRHRRLPVHARGAATGCVSATPAGSSPSPRSASHHGSRYTSGYTASKHAVLGLTRAVAAEVAGTGITANCGLPGVRALAT